VGINIFKKQWCADEPVQLPLICSMGYYYSALTTVFFVIAQEALHDILIKGSDNQTS